jgi:hypothetical protein
MPTKRHGTHHVAVSDANICHSLLEIALKYGLLILKCLVLFALLVAIIDYSFAESLVI